MKKLIPFIVSALALCVSSLKADTNPQEVAKNAPISLSGKVLEAGPNGFTLDYGISTVTVEMDDYDPAREGMSIVAGDDVTVYGRLDRDPAEVTKIEASAVYVTALNTVYYANSADEEDLLTPVNFLPQGESYATFRGNVTLVGSDYFILESGIRNLKVSIETLGYNPLDREGMQQVNVGDRLQVSGEFDWNLLSKDEIEASSITILRDRPAR